MVNKNHIGFGALSVIALVFITQAVVSTTATNQLAQVATSTPPEIEIPVEPTPPIEPIATTTEPTATTTPETSTSTEPTVATEAAGEEEAPIPAPTPVIAEVEDISPTTPEPTFTDELSFQTPADCHSEEARVFFRHPGECLRMVRSGGF